jgi:predicted dehydrogenase
MLKVGIAGYGIVGKKRHECVNKIANAEVTAICDRKFAPGTSLGGNVSVHQSYEELLGNDLDVLFVCMPNDMAPIATAAGLEKGLHVFCEKPPGRNVEDIQKVIKAHEKVPAVVLRYGFNHRYHESVQEALAIIKSGELGQIINMRGVYGKSKLITFNQPDWRTKRDEAGGGVLLDQGIHMVDLMRLFAGEFNEIYSFIENNHWKYEVEDNAYAMMRTDDGVVAMLNSSATQWRHRFSLDINLTKGSLVLSGILSGSKSYGAETLTIIYADPDNDGGDPKEYTIRYNTDPSWDVEVSEFFNSINHGTQVLNGSSHDALMTMKLVYQIYFEDKRWRDKFQIESPNYYE